MAANGSTCRHTCQELIVWMFITSTLLMCILNIADICVAEDTYSEKHERSPPTVSIAVLVRNKAHTLPWFLGQLEKLDYPKHRINLWFRSDHNIDNSSAMLQEWITAVQPLYHRIDVKIDNTTARYPNEKSNCDWTEERFDNVIQLRQEALDDARNVWADYLFMLDADVMLEHNQTLQLLMAQDRTVIGPMLNTSVDGIYSNFWAGMSKDGFYKRTPEYIPIVDREKLGVFPVPMVHSAVLVDLRHKVTEQFSYSAPPKDYNGPTDDIIIFAHTVRHAGISFHVMNSEYFGTVQVPMDESYSLEFEKDQFTHTKLEAMVEGPELYHSPHVSLPNIPADMLGFDQVYVINLLRRPERRQRMIATMYDLGIQVKFVDAVDGKQLNDTYMDSLGIDMLPGYADPYSHRALTLGEIGCFLSHYFIWVEMMEKGYERVLVFEDDVRFEAYFRKKFAYMLKEAQDYVPSWELIYLGRKILQSRQEYLVKGTENLVWPSYSYWTLSYMLQRSGAKKLLDQKPLGKMIPVDEFLPIMFDKHPEHDWRLQFEPRNLVGLSADPLLVFPTHYTGEENYISDTEVSNIIPTEDIEDKPGVDTIPTIEDTAKCKPPECIHDEF
ncbi:inactive glycosyltransferase 25 family member 3-like [Haliotis rufescens]|uniref:inactive glycosyltransferase 25 family member 3-like n=1 Tax=Haliotis rufescens TaxID=6454 RepID=UPI001EAF9E7E|nr:inactive glycosyltransferase 25 family member 3-like [Haliotis rufescens]